MSVHHPMPKLQNENEWGEGADSLGRVLGVFGECGEIVGRV